MDLLAVQGALESLLQHHSLKASVLQCSAFFMVQLSHLYMTTGKIIALTIQTFVSELMFLFFNTLSRFVFFGVLVLESLVGLHRTVQLQLLQHYWLGHRLGLL